MSAIRNIRVGVRVFEDNGTQRNADFPIHDSDEILIAMLEARWKAWEAQYAGGETFNDIG